MSAQIQIFLRTESAMRRELWRTFLSTPRQTCISSFDELPAKIPIDVVLTDQEMDDESRKKMALGQGEFDGGVILIGLGEQDEDSDVTPQDPVVGPASVSLPGNATARELKLGVLLVHQIVQLGRDRGTQKQLSHTYEQLALQDPLTAIANRRAWDTELARRWEKRSSGDAPYCLALLDVDQLKQVNDLVGHAEGDAVLRSVASALVASIRDRDFVARIGGDEFGLLLENVGPESAQGVVDRIRCSTSRYLATGKALPDELPVTTSAGYTCSQADDTADSLYRRADEALRTAKKAGNNVTMGCTD